jgi:hypothetical protein
VSDAVKSPKPYEWQAFGILNPYGDLWTPEFFEDPEDAFEHMKVFWGPTYEDKARGFKVVPVDVMVTAYNLECAISPPWDQPGGSAEGVAAQVEGESSREEPLPLPPAGEG